MSGPVSQLEAAHKLALEAIEKNKRLLAEGKSLPAAGGEFKGSEDRKEAGRARRAAWEMQAGSGSAGSQDAPPAAAAWQPNPWGACSSLAALAAEPMGAGSSLAALAAEPMAGCTCLAAGSCSLAAPCCADPSATWAVGAAVGSCCADPSATWAVAGRQPNSRAGQTCCSCKVLEQLERLELCPRPSQQEQQHQQLFSHTLLCTLEATGQEGTQGSEGSQAQARGQEGQKGEDGTQAHGQEGTSQG